MLDCQIIIVENVTLKNVSREMKMLALINRMYVTETREMLEKMVGWQLKGTDNFQRKENVKSAKWNVQKMLKKGNGQTCK